MTNVDTCARRHVQPCSPGTCVFQELENPEPGMRRAVWLWRAGHRGLVRSGCKCSRAVLKYLYFPL